MSKLKIPEAAIEAVVMVRVKEDAITDMLRAAAPLIVAAELRRMAEKWLQEARSSSDKFDSRIYAAIKIATNKLRNRADELDPQGVTK